MQGQRRRSTVQRSPMSTPVKRRSSAQLDPATPTEGGATALESSLLHFLHQHHITAASLRHQTGFNRSFPTISPISDLQSNFAFVTIGI